MKKRDGILLFQERMNDAYDVMRTAWFIWDEEHNDVVKEVRFTNYINSFNNCAELLELATEFYPDVFGRFGFKSCEGWLHGLYYEKCLDSNVVIPINVRSMYTVARLRAGKSPAK